MLGRRAIFTLSILSEHQHHSYVPDLGWTDSLRCPDILLYNSFHSFELGTHVWASAYWGDGISQGARLVWIGEDASCNCVASFSLALFSELYCRVRLCLLREGWIRNDVPLGSDLSMRPDRIHEWNVVVFSSLGVLCHVRLLLSWLSSRCLVLSHPLLLLFLLRLLYLPARRPAVYLMRLFLRH